MKKLSTRDYFYQIPEKSGFPPMQTQGFPAYVFIHHAEFDQIELQHLLEKILTAIKLRAEENAKIISCQDGFIYPVRELQYSGQIRIISFGIKPAQLHLQGFESLESIYTYQNLQLLFLNSLATYTTDQAKKKLWQLLKQLFEL